MHVDASADWTDTAIPVLAGDTLTFKATGQIALAGHTLGPEGMLRGWRDMLRRFPVDTANAGALVARIGDSAAAVPFAIGTASTVTATQTGTLFLRVNSSAELPATGSFTVDLRVSPAASAATAQAPARQGTRGNDASRGNGAAESMRSAAHIVPGTVSLPFAELTPATLDALPRRVADSSGEPGDAINFAMVGTEQQVRDAFAHSGWITVDTDTASAVVHGLLNTLEHKPYVEVPMSTLYLFNRSQDLSFARASAIAVAADRHHLRCWRTGETVGGVPLWVGAATHDIGFERDGRNGRITHRIAPEIDQERDFLRDSFQGSGSAAAVAYFTPVDPVREARTATGGSFTTDGRVLLLQLR